VDLIVAGLAVTAFLLYGRLRSWPSAALFAAAVAIKLTPAVIVLALVAYRRDWPLLLKTLAVGVIIFAASLLAVQWELYVEYASKVLPLVSRGNEWLYHNQSLLRGWGGQLAQWTKYASLAGYAFIVVVSGMAGRVWSRLSNTTSTGRSLASGDPYVLALAVVGVLLFSPLSWRMAFVWVVVPMTVVLAGAPWRGSRLQYVLVGAGAALMCLPVWDFVFLDALETIGALLAGAGLLGVVLRPDLQHEEAPLATAGRSPSAS
jgi:hypothetical protein